MQPLPPDDITDLLVAYALDALEPAEMRRVAALLDERPDLRALLAELRASADALPYGLAEQTPPADLRQRALDYAVGRGRAAPPAVRPGLARGWLAALGGLAALCLALLLLSVGELLSVRGQLDTAQQALATAQSGALEVQAVLAQPLRLAELRGSEGRATLIQSENGDMLLAAQLPPLAENRVYQLWVIVGENDPVSGGVFQVGADGGGLLTLGAGLPVAAGATLAVTAEPGPIGSPGPTGDVLIAGKM